MVVAWLIPVAFFAGVLAMVLLNLREEISKEQLRQAYAAEQEKVRRLDGRVADLEYQNRDLHGSLSEAGDHNADLQARLNDAEKLLEQANNHQAAALRQVEKLEREYEDERKRHGASRRERDEYFGRVKELEAENQELRASFDEHLAAHKSVKEELNAKCVSLQHRLNDVAAEKSKALEREKDAYQEAHRLLTRGRELSNLLHGIREKIQEVIE